MGFILNEKMVQNMRSQSMYYTLLIERRIKHIWPYQLMQSIWKNSTHFHDKNAHRLGREED